MKNVCVEFTDDQHAQLLANAKAAGFEGPSAFIRAVTLGLVADNDTAHAKLKTIADLTPGQTFVMRSLFSFDEWNSMPRRQRLSISRAMHRLVRSDYHHLAQRITATGAYGAAEFVRTNHGK